MPLTIREYLATATLQLSHLDEGTTIARALLAYVLRRDTSWLWAHPDELISAQERQTFQHLVHRAGQHEPLAYLTGCQFFYGQPFEVTPDTLIPRPESELLIEKAVTFAASIERLPDFEQTLTIADVGTGSGCLAITLARLIPEARVFAIDISPAALAVAQRNANRHNVQDRIVFLNGSLLSPLKHHLPQFSVDIMVANLPYISDSEYEVLPANVRNFEPALALRSGPVAGTLNEQLAKQSRQWLKPNSLLAYETTNGKVVVV
jgi:release factor glutamine methyltransferase